MKHVNLLEEEWEFLTDLLPQDWREQARTTGALRRARGVSSADCLLQLILMHTATGLSLRQTVVRARQQSIADISDVALLKRLRASEPWLRALTAKMTDLDEPGVVQRLADSPLRPPHRVLPQTHASGWAAGNRYPQGKKNLARRINCSINRPHRSLA